MNGRPHTAPPEVGTKVLLVAAIAESTYGLPLSADALQALHERLAGGGECPPVWWLKQRLAQMRAEKREQI